MMPYLHGATGLLLWCAGLLGVLQIGRVGFGANAHSICGPWGCGPPTSALVAWHGFWLVLAAPFVGLVIRYWPARRLRAVGLLALGAAGLMVMGIVIWEAATWLPLVSGQYRIYFAHRILFSLVTLTDIPVILVSCAGMAMYMSGLFKKREVYYTTP